MEDIKDKCNPLVFDAVKDSGAREQFATGAVRDIQAGKGWPHIIPTTALLRLAKHFQNGAVKYGKNNWQKGIPLSSYLDSAFRHWCAVKDCKQDEDHLSALIWNAACFMETVELIKQGKIPKEIDDIGYINANSKN